MNTALEIDISDFSDFCFGVKRAISIAENALRGNPPPVFSLGPLIHNRQVVGALSEKGLRVAGGPDGVKKGTLVIRSHGIAADILAKIKKNKIRIVDATCPFVKNAQKIARRLSREGLRLIIIGDKGHPEVQALKSFAGDGASVISGKTGAKRLKPSGGRIGVIAQTTQSVENFLEVVSELLRKGFDEIRIFNTICRDANMRQESARRCCEKNDLVIVVGGKNSANTRRLYEICRGMGREARHVETGGEIDKRWLKGKSAVGVVSGASTPRWIVDGVVKHLRQKRA